MANTRSHFVEEGGFPYYVKDHSRLGWEILPAFTRLTGCVEASYTLRHPAGVHTPTCTFSYLMLVMNTP